MVKKLFLVLLLVAPLSMFAQDKLAYINADEVFYKMPEIKDVETKLATAREGIIKTKESMEKEYQLTVEKYSKTPADSLTQALSQARLKELQDMDERYQVYLQQSAQELEKQQQDLLAPLRDKFAKAVKEVGDENGYTYIMNVAIMLHIGSNAVDAGPKVKAKLGITN